MGYGSVKVLLLKCYWDKNEKMISPCLSMNQWPWNDVVRIITSATRSNIWISKGVILTLARGLVLPDSMVHEAYMGPTWCPQDPGGSHVGPINLVIRVESVLSIISNHKTLQNIFLYIYRMDQTSLPMIIPWFWLEWFKYAIVWTTLSCYFKVA